MGVHGDDVLVAIRKGLKDVCPIMDDWEDVEYAGDGVTGWPNRDGKISFKATGRDGFRTFKITIEVV